MIGCCDICDRRNVPVTHFSPEQSPAGCDTSACFICQGDTDPDPYLEIDEPANELLRDDAQFGVGA